MAIAMADIKKVILEEDDFGHELRVGNIFENVRSPATGFEQMRVFHPEHGGTYTDRVTGKTRQFDYRCRISREDGHQDILLAVECKNLNPDLPLVVCGRPRTTEESFHMFLRRTTSRPLVNIVMERREGFDSIYQPDGFVGKSILRLKKRGTDLCSDGDSEIYDRWSQAMSSCYDLCEHAFDGHSEGDYGFAFVMPIVVVPNSSLWKANYDANGTLHEDPSEVDTCEYYINQKIPIHLGREVRITHVHFVTLTGLSEMLGNFVAPRTRAWKNIFGGQPG